MLQGFRTKHPSFVFGFILAIISLIACLLVEPFSNLIGIALLHDPLKNITIGFGLLLLALLAAIRPSAHPFKDYLSFGGIFGLIVSLSLIAVIIWVVGFFSLDSVLYGSGKVESIKPFALLMGAAIFVTPIVLGLLLGSGMAVISASVKELKHKSKAK